MGPKGRGSRNMCYIQTLTWTLCSNICTFYLLLRVYAAFLHSFLFSFLWLFLPFHQISLFYPKISFLKPIIKNILLIFDSQYLAVPKISSISFTNMQKDTPKIKKKKKKTHGKKKDHNYINMQKRVMCIFPLNI